MSAWDRQAEEPGAWFARFDLYFRPLGPMRTIQAAFVAWVEDGRPGAERAERGGKQSPATAASRHWYDNAAKYSWKARGDAWDDAQRMLRLQAEEQALADMHKRHARTATMLQSLGMQRLKALADSLEKDPLHILDLTLAEARAMIREGVMTERQARGIPAWAIGLLNMDEQRVEDLYQTIFGISAEDEQAEEE